MRRLRILVVMCGAAAMIMPTLAAAITADEAFERWRASAGRITALECVLEMHVRNRGAHGKLLQEFTQRRRLWCDKVHHTLSTRLGSRAPPSTAPAGRRNTCRPVLAGCR